jgi:hypothetical protein
MISFVRNDMQAFNTTSEKIAPFERMLVALDLNIMSGEVFKGCIEQNYEINVSETGEEITIQVRDNETFLGELLHCMRSVVDNALANIGKPIELKDREEVVGCFALYALYRQLVPPRVAPDAKIQKLLWSAQKVVPAVVLYHKVRLFSRVYSFHRPL